MGVFLKSLKICLNVTSTSWLRLKTTPRHGEADRGSRGETGTDADKIATGSAQTHTDSHITIHMTYTDTSNRFRSWKNIQISLR